MTEYGIKRGALKQLVPGRDLNTVTVGKHGCDYTTVSAALASITDAASDNVYCIVGYGNVDESISAEIYWKSHVYLYGVGFNWNITKTSNNGMVIESDIVDVIIDNVNINFSGNSTGAMCAVNIRGGDGVIIRNSKITSNCVTSSGNSTLLSCSARVDNGELSYNVQIINCDILLNDTAVSMPYAVSCVHASPLFKNCNIAVGNISRGAYTITAAGNSNAVFENCVIYKGTYGSDRAVYINGSAPTFKGCRITDQSIHVRFNYIGGGYSTLPFASYPYMIKNIYLSVSSAGAPGSVIDIGTTDGGTEIVGGIDASTTGQKLASFNHATLAADAPFYIKPSDTSTRFYVVYTVMYNNSGYGLYFRPFSGVAEVSDCVIAVNAATHATYFTDLITSDQQMVTNSLISTYAGTGTGVYAIESSISQRVPVYNCKVVGDISTNVIMERTLSGTAATISAGDTYVDVTHGLNDTPTTVRVTPTTNLGTRSFWVDTKGASTFRININSSDSIDHTFDWEAEV